jgi:hypothetical protein
MHNFGVYWISLYMFWTVFPSIIRSSRLYTQYHVYVIQVSWQLASKQSSYVYISKVEMTHCGNSTLFYMIKKTLCWSGNALSVGIMLRNASNRTVLNTCTLVTCKSEVQQQVNISCSVTLWCFTPVGEC